MQSLLCFPAHLQNYSYLHLFSFLSPDVTEEVALLLLKVDLSIYVLEPMSPHLKAFFFPYSLAFLLHHQLHMLGPIFLTAYKHILKYLLLK
mgnify:CR=1 FL=1